MVEAPHTPVMGARRAPGHRLASFLGSMVPRSLASRLIVGAVTLSAVLVAVPGYLAYARVRSDLTSRLDSQLTAAAQGSLYQVIHDEHDHGPTPQVLWMTQLGNGGAVLDVLPSSGEVRHMWLSEDDRARLASPDPQPVTVRTMDGQSLRVMSEPQPQLQGTVVIGLSTDSVQGPLHRLVLLELLLAFAAAVVAASAAIGIRYSLRPLKRLTTTARLVSADLAMPGARLSRRAPVDEGQSNTEAGELTQAFNALLDAVEDEFTARTVSEHRMRQFLADASHELRTPLTSIRGYAELERMRHSRAGSETTSDSMARIEAEGNRMARLVDDLLTLARGDHGQALATSPVNLTELVREAVELTRAAHPNREIISAVETGLAVLGDEPALLRVMRNLLTNAAIHTDPRGRISLDARLYDDKVVVSVADDGPGMTDEQASHAFDRFWRADDSRVRTTGGSGLGLAIAESIVVAHRGTVELHTSGTTGTTITIRLPAVR